MCSSDRLYTIMRISLVVTLSAVFLPPPSILAADPVHNSTSRWHLGEGLGELDSFSYKICTNRVLAHFDSECVIIRLEFIRVLNGWNGPVWIVQAGFGAYGVLEEPELQDAILRISADGKFAISSDPQHKEASSLIMDTLFWLDAYAGRHDAQSLEVGAYWGDVMSSRLYVHSIDMEAVGGTSVEVATVGYDGGKDSVIKVLDEFPFPIKATVYRPVGNTATSQLHYEFALIDYVRGSSTNYESEPSAQSTDLQVADPADKAKHDIMDLILGNPQTAAMMISQICEIAHKAHDAIEGMTRLCVDDLIDAYVELGGAVLPDHGLTHVELEPDQGFCTGSLVEAMCYVGIVDSVGEAALHIGGNLVRLSLVGITDDEWSQHAMYSSLESECAPGSWATVDVDDLNPVDVHGNYMGAVYCKNETPVNAILLNGGLAPADTLQCANSEFALRDWATACDV